MKRTSMVFAICAVLAATLFASCASSKKTETTTNSFLTDWVETGLTDLEDCGYFYTTPELGQFDMLEGEFKKTTGYAKSAYGFVFGYAKPSAEGKLSTYLRFEINTDGEYALYRFDGSNYIDLVESNDKGTAYFYENGAINKGYDATNKLKVEINSNGRYDLFINGTKVATNVAPLKDGTHGIMAFFSVGKQDQEKLPDQPVKVTYRITDGKVHVPTAAELKANTPEK